MAIGMTYEQYWYGDPLMVRAFYEADKIRKEREDYEAWLHGLYVLNALNASVGNMFRKSGQPVKYPTEPFSVTEKKERQRQKEIDEEQEALIAQAWMSSFVQAGKNWGRK